jgi:hypothetical protein
MSALEKPNVRREGIPKNHVVGSEKPETQSRPKTRNDFNRLEERTHPYREPRLGARFTIWEV